MSDFTRSRGCGAPLFTTADSCCAAESDRAAETCSCRAADSGRAADSCPCRAAETCPCRAADSCPCRAAAQSAASCPGADANTPDDDACGCCKASMREALRLLCSNQISDLLDFDGFAFVTDDLLVGAQTQAMTETSKDNLTTPEGTFRRFSPCNCDLIDISGTAYGPFGALIDVDQATLCSLSAIVFQVNDSATTPTPTVCDCFTTPEARYRRVRDLLQCELSSVCQACGECVCHCDCTDDCCCARGVLAALSGLSLNKRATLIAGLLALRGVTVLGTIGNVLVLGNDTNYRFYFVCANKVELLA